MSQIGSVKRTELDGFRAGPWHPRVGHLWSDQFETGNKLRHLAASDRQTQASGRSCAARNGPMPARGGSGMETILEFFSWLRGVTGAKADGRVTFWTLFSFLDGPLAVFRHCLTGGQPVDGATVRRAILRELGVWTGVKPCQSFYVAGSADAVGQARFARQSSRGTTSRRRRHGNGMSDRLERGGPEELGR